jgi:hypothetical protein
VDKEQKMLLQTKLHSRIVLAMVVLLLTAIAFSTLSVVVEASERNMVMRDRKTSAQEIWSSLEELDRHVDAIRADLQTRGVSEQTVVSLEQYREHLHHSFLTGEPLANSEMEATLFRSAEDLAEELRARGVGENLQDDIVTRFREFKKSQQSE